MLMTVLNIEKKRRGGGGNLFVDRNQEDDQKKNYISISSNCISLSRLSISPSIIQFSRESSDSNHHRIKINKRESLIINCEDLKVQQNEPSSLEKRDQ